MTDTSKQALTLHQQGLSFSAIGKQLGMSRQGAQYHVRKAEASLPDLTVRDRFEPADPQGGEVPFSVGVRTGIDASAVIGGRTLSGLSTLLREALTGGDTKPLYRIYREMVQRDANYRSVRETRINQVAALPLRLTPGGSLARDRRVAEWIEGQLKSAVFQQCVPLLLEAVFDDVSVCPFALKPGVERSPLDWMDHIDNWNLTFSKKDGRRLYVASREQGGKPEEIDLRTVVVHYCKRSGQVPGSGLAMAATWLYVLKWLAIRDWASLCAVYGKPVKIGKYKHGTNAKEIHALRQAVAQLGSEAAAVVADTMTLEFMKDASASGSADMFERFIRYCDESLAKLVLGASLTTGTSNTGSGGSQALGVVHNELRADIMRADAKSLGFSVQALVNTLTSVNFGDDVPPPTVEFVVEEPEDVVALAGVAEKAQKLGLPLSKKGLAARLNVPLADEDDPDDLLQPLDGQASAGADEEAPTEGKTRKSKKNGFSQQASFAATEDRDALDDLVDLAAEDWEQLTSGIDAALTEVARSSTNLDDLRAKLASFASGEVDVRQLQNYLTQLRTNARLAGDSGAEV